MNGGYVAYFKGKKVTLMGLGLLGRGVGDARFLAEYGAELVVTDLKTEEQLEASLEQLKQFSNITFRLGGHFLEDFRDRDLILKAAGVPQGSVYIAEAKKNHIPVRMSADLFAELARVPTIGITGTRGKSTVTECIAHILKTAGREVLLGGNVRGVSTLSLLPQVTQASVAVLELDSWQLQGFAEAKIGPNIAVFTTFLPDHMNYYKGNMETYFADKAAIFLNQTESDVLILGEQVAPFLKEYSYQKKIKSRVEIVGAKNLLKSITLKIPGEHNRYNAALAAAAARAFGVDEEIITESLKTFAGVPGRLQFLKEINGVKVYNDNNSTVPDATVAALEALGDESQKKIILIMGGSEKNLDMSGLVVEVKKYCKKVVLLAGAGTDRIAPELPGTTIYRSIDEATAAAFVAAESGDTLLFSPAFASFGMFKNEYDRGDQFVALVEKQAERA
ncbi:MAG: UDP-N-acetylmuramoyl-L-alanine--D-glutamate ligase [bacterium]